jgi:acyl CoA:acetate/3-ketoacid CoA transferase beta subunit
VTDTATEGATLDEICVAALADAFRGDGELLCNPIGVVPICGGRLARETSEPDLMMTDTVAALVANTIPIGVANPEKVIEAYMPYRSIFDVVWTGRRHVVMGASQIDRWGNQNLAAIGDWRKPKAQLLGLRGAPGNVINHTVSYWIPNHSPQVFVEKVDVVSAPGYDKIRALPPASGKYFEIRRVVSNLGVFDFATDDNRMRLASRHPGVSVEQIVEATTFELVIEGDVPETRLPTDEELRILREVIDPKGARKAEFK